MMVFLDSSAVIAVLDRSQPMNRQAARSWRALVESEHTLVTSSYVVVETIAILQRRFGLPAVADVEATIWPLVDVEWVDGPVHRAAIQTLVLVGRRDLSLVDCVNFQIMQSLGLRHAFAFDRHFEERGYTLPPFPEAEVQ